ncbi:MAG: glycosyltransferase family 87 protein [Candidatus Binatia bacterium]
MSSDNGADEAGLLERLRSALDRLTRPPLLGAVAGFLLLLLLLVSGLHLARLEPPAGGELQIGTGDFLAFWTGAVMLHEGHGALLYDLAAQRQVQAKILGGVAPDFQPYLNPPLLALLLSPLVPLGYLPAFYLFDLVCVASLAAGLAMLLRLVPAVRAQPGAGWTVAVLVAGYQPMLQTTIGGQNTAITFALLAGFALARRNGSALGAAAALGLLTYKPQYAVGLSVALLLAGRWRLVMAGAVAGVAHWALGALWSGPLWPLRMLDLLATYRPLELERNADTHFSWTRVSDFLMPSPFDTVAACAGVALVLLVWWRYRDLGRRGDPAWMALVICGTMAVSPHQQYYDVALLTLPLVLLVERSVAAHGTLSRTARLLLAAAYVGYPAWKFADTIGIQPLFFVLVGTGAWALRCCREVEEGSAPAAAKC